jgi:bifunctional oligoribonuclease and PAP phosphatase NrnA
MVWTSENAAKSSALLHEAQRIVITCHKSPDGDAIGSTLALYTTLHKLGKQVVAIIPDAIPDYLSWIPNVKDALVFDRDNENAKAAIASADLIFSLDYNNLSRVGAEMEKALRSASARFILIDHHQQPEDFFEVTYSDTAACSTCEMVYHFITHLGWKNILDVPIAECLYTGIMTDTGSFRFPAVTPETHRIAAELMDLGLDHARVHREVYDTNLLDRMRLVGYALHQKLTVLPEAGVAYIWLSRSELEQFHYRSGDTEGLVNQALSLHGVKLAAFFREGNNEIKISFRSKGSFDVNRFARDTWNGGGHKNAAGGSSSTSLEETVQQFVAQVQSMADQIMAS